jgi:ribosomal-protein-alanine N-acetyltransferase
MFHGVLSISLESYALFHLWYKEFIDSPKLIPYFQVMNTPSSPRLHYEAFNSSHAEDYLSWVRNAEIMRYISGKPLSDEAAQIRLSRSIKLGQDLPHGGYFHVRNMDHAPVGFCKIQLLRPEVLELGYIVALEFQKQGYASEMVVALIDHAQAHFPGYEIMALVDPENAGSIRVLEKNGFVYEKEFRKDGIISSYYRFGTISRH